MRELYNNIYSRLAEEKQKKILKVLAEKYNMEIIRFETFSRYSKSNFTAIFKYKDSEFVFVPGDTVILGYEAVPKGISKKSLDEIEKHSLAYGVTAHKLMDKLIKEHFSKIREVTIKPMLVERKMQTLWRKSNLDELNNLADTHLIKEYNNFKNRKDKEYKTLIISDKVKFTKKENNEIDIELYDMLTYKKLLKKIKKENFSLANIDEWEYLCGGGCRTFFPWGNDIDYNMNLLYFSKNESKEYDLEKDNFFGLSIAYDPYKMEVIEADKLLLKGGDGGWQVCEGWGVFFAYMSSSPYFTVKTYASDELDADYCFYRRIIRIEE